MLKIIKLIFGSLWKILSGIRIVFTNLIILVLVIVIISAIASSPQPISANQSALLLTPSGLIVDQLTYAPSPTDLLSSPPEMPPETLLRDLTDAINYAAKDPEITGLILQLDYLNGAGVSKIEELGQSIEAFKLSGKPVVAYADSYSQQQYLLASYADTIYMNDFGSIFLTGFGMYRNYTKEATDKLSLKFHVFRVGEFKDAIEPFIRNDMSKSSREHNSVWLSQLWEKYTQTIEKHRKLPAGTINTYIEQMDSQLTQLNGNAAQLAKNANLIDKIASRTAISDILKDTFGSKENGESVRSIRSADYLISQSSKRMPKKDNIGLIMASGTILDGSQPNGAIGSDSLAKLIKSASRDTSLSALILRIDSGGGSAFASEVIREYLLKAKAGGLPIYVSMGSMAASGGYWIATAADEIWATSSTLTGSIGVWGLIPNVSESIKRLGIHSDGVGTTNLADVMHPERPMSEQAQRIIQTSVDHIYSEFLSRVALARKKTPEEIHTIAQGRVWSGQSALELGLIDQLGSLDELIQSIAEKNKLTHYGVKLIEPELTMEEKIIRSVMQNVSHTTTQTLQANSVFSTLTQLVTTLDFLTPTINSIAQPNQGTPTILAQCLSCEIH